MSDHTALVRTVKEAVKMLFNDRSVPPKTTFNSLEEVKQLIDEYLEALDTDGLISTKNMEDV